MLLSKLAVRRLTKLADYMAKLPKWAGKHFAMDAVAKGAEFENELLSLETLKECGTTACAMGWAATIPYFRKKGFTVNINRWGGNTNIRESEFFDITQEQSHYLFYEPQEIKTPKQWSRHARAFIKANS